VYAWRRANSARSTRRERYVIDEPRDDVEDIALAVVRRRIGLRASQRVERGADIVIAARGVLWRLALS
jgi:hypothetical protein